VRVALRTSNRRINTQSTNFFVGWRLPTVAVDRRDDSVEIVKHVLPALALCGHPDTEITSGPPTVRIFQ